MDTGDGKEQTIKEQVEEVNELLLILITNIDSLIERNPKPEIASPDAAQRPDNVFDEIITTLRSCRGRVREATEKIQGGIANKVH